MGSDVENDALLGEEQDYDQYVHPCKKYQERTECGSFASWIPVSLGLCVLVLTVCILALVCGIARQITFNAVKTDGLVAQVAGLTVTAARLQQAQDAELSGHDHVQEKFPSGPIVSILETGAISKGKGKNQTPSIRVCPRSPEAARQAGCIFDIWSYGWHPQECFDQELYDTMLALQFDDFKPHNWTWRLPPPTRRVVPMEEVVAGLHEAVETTWDWHVTHCRYALLKVTRNLVRGDPLDEWSSAYKHTQHCAWVLHNHEWLDGDAMLTTDNMWYPACGTGDSLREGLGDAYSSDAEAELRGALAPVVPGTHWY
jgi:hypothetical protein